MSAAYSEPEHRGYYIEELKVGMTAYFSRAITDDDVVSFSQLSGDTNPVHLDEGYAATTPFQGRIVHGFLSASLISAAIALQLPGPGSIYLSQNLSFKAPVRIGDMVEARVTVQELIPERGRVVLATVCSVGNQVVIEGEALVRAPSRPVAVA
ncbi:(R)-specific enoyl-CoA hydratase [Aliidongia dinghuensis]|uniref:(R)-specific enoyl-CoA hydratase n=2 Tax=Aliidongia dinghuensis TaxID=1867774 RepID=A0A8J2YR51_9PROT|nr:(R)-specific enoyl-CoA hydratase [Aliidongia dinghuensis]